MGHGIAQVCAQRGFQVNLEDIKEESDMPSPYYFCLKHLLSVYYRDGSGDEKAG